MSLWRRVRESPPALLVLTGFFLGLNFPLGRIASEAGVSPLVWASVLAAGAWVLLSPPVLLLDKRIPVQRVHLQYYLVSSVFSLVIPNTLIFAVIIALGSGFTSILFTLSPIFTLVFSALWQVRIPNRLGIVGIGFGMVGALVVTATRGELGQPAGIGWVLAGLCIPVSLAVGNVYRTVYWPDGATPTQLAVGSNFSAFALLALAAICFDGAAAFASLSAVPIWVFVQMVVSAAMFSVFFRLQQVGGPTYLSQIGFVASAVALAIGTLLLGERYSLITWFGAAVIVIGVMLGAAAQRSR